MTASPPASVSAGLLGAGGRVLDEQEVTRLAERVAARPGLWRPLVRQDALSRHCESLYVDEHVGIWVIGWMPGHDTGWHDHAGSWGAVAVAKGRIREERPEWGGDARVIEAVASESFAFGDADVHRVVAVGPEPVVTVHVYSPPLRAMGVYEIGSDGRPRRTVVSWAETLRA